MVQKENYQKKNSDIPEESLKETDELPKASFRWKEHPLAIAATTAVGSIGVTVLIFSSIVIPTQMASNENKIASLSDKVASLSGKVVSLSDELKIAGDYKLEAEKKLSELEQQLFEAQQVNLFGYGNPYPTGLGKIRIGDAISKLASEYPEDAIEKKDGYYSVSNQHKVFTDIVYYFDEDQPNKPITHISFSTSYSSKLPKNFLLSKLIDALGCPIVVKKTYFSWHTTNFSAYQSDSSSFLLLPKDKVPSYWP